MPDPGNVLLSVLAKAEQWQLAADLLAPGDELNTYRHGDHPKNSIGCALVHGRMQLKSQGVSRQYLTKSRGDPGAEQRSFVVEEVAVAMWVVMASPNYADGRFRDCGRKHQNMLATEIWYRKIS